MQLQEKDGDDGEVVLVILESGGRWSARAQELHRLAPNGLVLAQDAAEPARAFATRVGRRVRQLGESGRSLRAALLSVGLAEGGDLLAARCLIVQALERTACAADCSLTVTGSEELPDSALRGVEAFLDAMAWHPGSSGPRLVLDLGDPRRRAPRPSLGPSVDALASTAA